jgi:PTS system nitrogen regulatory IIA component
MQFRNLIDDSFVFVNRSSDNYPDALREIIATFAGNPGIGCTEPDMMEALLKREELGGTVLPNGLAIPHVRLDCLDEFWIAVYTPAKPLLHQELEVRLICLFLIPSSGSDIYLQTLSGLTKYTAQAEVMDSVSKASTVGGLLSVFDRLDIKKDFLVRDIMTREMITIGPETKLREVADLLYSRNLSYIPVMTDAGQFIGEVTLLDIIREGIPDYALRIGDISFLKSFEPFEELIRKEDVLTAGQFMSKPEQTVHPDDSIASAGLAFVRSSRRQLPVVQGNQLVGVLSITDLLKKVIRV